MHGIKGSLLLYSTLPSSSLLTILQPKAVPAASSSAAPSTPAQASSQTPAPPAAPAPASNTTSDAPATPSPAPTAGTTTESGNFNDPSSLALGAQRENAIANMESMGFPRDEINRAMRAAFFNPDRAVEYLLTGIPENVQQEQQANRPQGTPNPSNPAPPPPAFGATQTPAADPSATADADAPINLFEAAAQQNRQGGNRGSNTAGGRSQVAEAARALNTAPGVQNATTGGEAGNLDFLRTNPQFQQLRQIVQTQPRMLEPILQQVGAGNPQLAALIGQHPDQFLQLLAEDTEGDTPLPPGAQEISVTEEERSAIERLCLLGFERDLVIQAYFACDKNEELAANFLFDQVSHPPPPPRPRPHPY